MVAQRRVPLVAVYVVFFVSGFAALLYQTTWQRALFTLFGTNIESVTVVVTAFMAGLGLGSLVGGKLSDSETRPLLPIFAAIELATALYGAFSLDLFAWAGAGVAGSTGQTAVVSFSLVLLPTLLMGSTLPLLAAHLVRAYGDVGRSVGVLYAVNTFGAAAGALVSATVLLRHLGLSGTTLLAVALNGLVGVVVLAMWWRR